MRFSSDRTKFQGNRTEMSRNVTTNFSNVGFTDLRPIKGAKLPPGDVYTPCSTHPSCAQPRSTISTACDASLKQPYVVSGNDCGNGSKYGHVFPQCRVHRPTSDQGHQIRFGGWVCRLSTNPSNAQPRLTNTTNGYASRKAPYQVSGKSS